MKEKQLEPDILSVEQEQDLARLQQSAAAESEALNVITETGESAAPSLSDELSGIITLMVKMFVPAFPSLEKLYTPETVGTVSVSVAAVCDKHGWMQGGVFGEWGEEITAAAVVVPLALATMQGVKSDIAARKVPAASVTDQQPVEGTKTVTFG